VSTSSSSSSERDRRSAEVAGQDEVDGAYLVDETETAEDEEREGALVMYGVY